MSGARPDLVALRDALARSRDDRGVASLGFAVLDHDAACAVVAADGPVESTTAVDDDDQTTSYINDARQRRLYECTARARDRLAAVRPTLARLRGVLPSPRGVAASRDHDLIVLAAADVARGLVHARRSMRALMAELAELEAESRSVLAMAASVEAERR